jgi:16S rRNA (guanine527-N7)-methyltransferase
MSPEAFQRRFDVSRETMQRIESHLALLAKWNPRINLVARSTLGDAWTRHVADSAQLWALRPADAGVWLDLGSGAGFPGLVIAALAAEQAPDLEIRLIESDARKAAFLAAAARETGLAPKILEARIEGLEPQAADVVSARALGPLSTLLGMAEKHRVPQGTGLFPKGATVQNELAEAARHWRFNHKIHASLTDPQAAIVEIGAIDRA